MGNKHYPYCSVLVCFKGRIRSYCTYI